MRKNRIFIILVVFTVLAFFATAATCNMCGTPVTVGETDESAEDTEEVSGAEEDGDGSAATGTEAPEDTAAPDGGAADEPDDEPADEPDDEPADEPDDEPADEPDDEPAGAPEDEPIGEGGGDSTVFTCDVKLNMCGYVSEDGSMLTRTVLVGDNDSNNAVKGYISFDITELRDSEILFARLSIPGIGLIHDPAFSDRMIIKVQDYGELDEDDFTTGGTHLAAVSTEGLTEINITADNLKTLIRQKIGEGKDYFQIKLGLEDYSDDDSEVDLFVIDPSAAVLRVEQ